MKRLISSFLFLVSLGANSQDARLLAELRPLASPFGSIVEPSRGPSTQSLRGLADQSFSKLGYAQAARTYDLVLQRPDAAHDRELLSKAGDAHYFNGNLKEAHRLYGELYRRYGHGISKERVPNDPDAKEMGRQRRALRLDRMYSQGGVRNIGNDSLAKWEPAYFTEIKNLDLNSKYSDFAPMFHKGNQLVFASSRDTGTAFSRRQKRNKQPFLDLYIADQVPGEGEYEGTRKFSNELNTKYHEASVAFSPDEKTIYFTRNDQGKNKKRRKQKEVNHLKIFRSSFVDGQWTKAEELPINGEDFSTGHPSLSPDGKRMYFVSDRPGGFGGTDIYMVDLLDNGGFSEPKNLGRTINTEAREMFPHITENGLYFSSDRAMGFGGLDVYRADHADGIFSVGVNLGEPINSRGDDFSFIVDASGQRGYFASNRKGGKGDDDIYSFTRIPNLNSISGIVYDAVTDQPLEEVRVALLDRAQKLLDETLTSADGSYVFHNLDPEAAYGIKTSKEGYGEQITQARTQDNQPVQVNPVLQREIPLLDKEKNQIVLDPEAIHFDFDRYNIKPQAARELDKLVSLLKDNPSLVIKIEAHTDAIGDSNYNLYLSDKRAKSTRDHLIAQGVDASQIQSAIGYGEERPLNECSDGTRCSKEKHRLNRRSEFYIVSQ